MGGGRGTHAVLCRLVLEVNPTRNTASSARADVIRDSVTVKTLARMNLHAYESGNAWHECDVSLTNETVYTREFFFRKRVRPTRRGIGVKRACKQRRWC